MSWPTRCLPWTTRPSVNQCDGCLDGRPVDANGNHRMGNGAYSDLMVCQRDSYAALCSGGFCHACEGCDIHCDCANTEEVRHIAGANVRVPQ